MRWSIRAVALVLALAGLMALPCAAGSAPSRMAVPPATVGDLVWEDGNLNGIQDPGEAGIGGVPVVLYNQAGSQVDSTVTDPSGSYAFSCIVPGTYSIGFTLSSEFAFVSQDRGTDDSRDSDASPATGRTAPFSLASGQVDHTRDAGMYKPAGPRPDRQARAPRRPASIAACPTAVVVARATAARTAAGVLLSWLTSSETGVLGFDLRRSGKRLNARLIAAKAPAGEGARYRFLDRTAGRSSRSAYTLETVYADGTRALTRFAPRG